MFVPVRITDKHSNTVDLPKPFLDYLLISGYKLGDDDILCIRMESPFGIYYCAMGIFTQEQFLEIPYNINEHLSAVDDMLIQLDRIPPVIPKTIVLQAHNDSFHRIPDLKEQLDHAFLNVKIINRGCTLYLQGDRIEPFIINRIMDENGDDLDWGTTVECDVNIDFIGTCEEIQRQKEQEQREREEAERRELEARGYLGEGNRLGGITSSRQAWLDRFEQKKQQSD